MKVIWTLLLSWSMKIITFLLRGVAWAAIGILIGFVVSHFFRFSGSGRIDILALTESMLAIVVTGLAIVGAFGVTFQWNSLDSRIQAFDTKVKKSNEAMDKKYTEISGGLAEATKDVRDVIEKTAEKIELEKEQGKLLNSISNRAEEQLGVFSKILIDCKSILDDIKSKEDTIRDFLKEGEKITNEIKQQKDTLSSNITIESELAGGANVGRNEGM